jgi:metallo-beta-lactamase family protein
LLADGVKAVKIQGDDIKVRAAIRQMDLYTGHADGDELLAWVRRRQPILRALYLVHGEDEQVNALHDAVIKSGMPADRAIAPILDDEMELLGDGIDTRVRPLPRRLQPEIIGHADWHNDLAQFSLDLRDVFERAADDRSRAALIRRLRRAVAGDYAFWVS